MSQIDFTRQPGETELAYIQRLGNAKQAGLIDMTWAELANVFNKNLREPGVEWTESAYRKKYASMQKFNEEFGSGKTGSEETDELNELLRDIKKEQIKLRDERNEYNKLIRNEARKESYMDQFVRSIESAAGNYRLHHIWHPGALKCISDTDMIISLTDLHAGLEVHNFWNNYDGDILKDRLNHYLDRIVEIQHRHNCEKAYVVISEILSGIIHPTLRIENNQDLIDQFLMATDYICEFLGNLSSHFEDINVYVAPGNHSRINPKKEQDLAHENMDNLIIPFIKARLQNYDNIHCFTNDIEQSMAMFTVRNLCIVGIHGDKDSPDKVINNLWNMYHAKVDIVLLGHRHTNAMLTCGDVKVVQSGCLCGTDSYAVDIRKSNRPEQAVIVISEKEGLDCIYDIKF